MVRSTFMLSLSSWGIDSQDTEINDFGYPQNSEIDTLKTYITTESIMSAATAVVRIRIIL